MIVFNFEIKVYVVDKPQNLLWNPVFRLFHVLIHCFSETVPTICWCWITKSSTSCLAFFFQVICITEEGSAKTPLIQYDTSTGFGKYLTQIIFSVAFTHFPKETCMFICMYLFVYAYIYVCVCIYINIYAS